jgi:carbamoyltransferase
MIAATEEERFTRVKHWAGFPVQAIRFCLKEAGITLQDVEHITIGRDPKAKYINKLNYLRKNPSLVFGAFKRLRNSQQVSSLEKLFLQVDPGMDYKLIKSKIRNIEHHRSHLASAFFASPFDEVRHYFT